MKFFSILFLLCFTQLLHAQKVSIGHSAPAAKLDVRGAGSSPTIPAILSTGILRIGVSNKEGIDIGKMSTVPYSGWIQTGYDGIIADPLCLQPSGGNVGIGTVNAITKLQIQGLAGNPTIPGSTSTGMIKIGTSESEGVDIGKMGIPPYSAWIQTGAGGTITDPLSLQPEGGSVSIGTTGPEGSAILDVTSTTQGLLPPRMTFAQRNAIDNPAAGLMIYCTDCEALQFFNGTIWKNLNGEPAVTFPYPYVKLCDQVWMNKNLNVSTYRNGDPIPKVTNAATWASLTTGAYCYYNNDSTTYAVYGKIYNWYAVNDPRGLAPDGWHIPNEAELVALGNCLGGAAVAGGKMKEVGTSHWLSPNSGASNSSGFTSLPSGTRYALDGHFFAVGELTAWWSTTLAPPVFVVVYGNQYNNPYLMSQSFDKTGGLPVRCIKN